VEEPRQATGGKSITVREQAGLMDTKIMLKLPKRKARDDDEYVELLEQDDENTMEVEGIVRVRPPKPPKNKKQRTVSKPYIEDSDEDQTPSIQQPVEPPPSDLPLVQAAGRCDRCVSSRTLCWVFVPGPKVSRRACHRCSRNRKGCSFTEGKGKGKAKKGRKSASGMNKGKEAEETEGEDEEAEQLTKKEKGKAKAKENKAYVLVPTLRQTRQQAKIKREESAELQWQMTGMLPPLMIFPSITFI